MRLCRLTYLRLSDSFDIVFRHGGQVGEADPAQRRGVGRGATVGNGVAVGAGVAVAVGLGVVTCACAPVKKDTKPIRTHTLMEANTDGIRAVAIECRS
jgi:hypothetical protein